jgi:hypothetical protein
VTGFDRISGGATGPRGLFCVGRMLIGDEAYGGLGRPAAKHAAQLEAREAIEVGADQPQVNRPSVRVSQSGSSRGKHFQAGPMLGSQRLECQPIAGIGIDHSHVQAGCWFVGSRSAITDNRASMHGSRSAGWFPSRAAVALLGDRPKATTVPVAPADAKIAS